MIEGHCESAVRITGNVDLKSNHKVVPWTRTDNPKRGYLSVGKLAAKCRRYLLNKRCRGSEMVSVTGRFANTNDTQRIFGESKNGVFAIDCLRDQQVNWTAEVDVLAGAAVSASDEKLKIHRFCYVGDDRSISWDHENRQCCSKEHHYYSIFYHIFHSCVSFQTEGGRHFSG